MEYDNHPQEWKSLFEVNPSKKAYEQVVMQSGFGQAAVKAQGDSVSYDTTMQGYVTTFTHAVYGLGYVVTMEEIDDNLYADVSKGRSSALALSLSTTINTVAANTYNRATTTGYNGGDGVVLLSASHPTRSGNQSNILNPAADLSEAALEDMLIQIAGAKNDRGLPVALMPDKLLIPRQEVYNAARILKSVLQNDTADNAINAMRVMNAIPGGFDVNHYFDDADQFFVRTKVPSKSGMLMFMRKPTTFSQDNDFDTENAKAKAVVRFSVGWGDWRAVYGSPGA
jgi:hypothetical protein